MVATTPPPAEPKKKLQKIEALKINSNYLRDPLQEELGNDELFLTHDAVIVMKYHGSYMQDNRDKRKKGVEKDYSFMLRLKSPAGEIPPELYLKLDEMSDKYGQGDLRITTRQAWQMHGIVKGNLKAVIREIMALGSSTVGACGDVSRNVMCPPAPLNEPAYQHARQYSKIMAELFKPMSPAVIDLWDGEDKVSTTEYWVKDLEKGGLDIPAALLKDTGRGVITSDPVEPLYGKQYLPKKFKIGITVPGDNSIDIYINDIGLVVITNPSTGELEGFNVMVGGGLGRTHGKDTTFPRAASHFGFVSKDDVMELCKCIIAAQRDHGNREIRQNARMKYLVHNLGVDGFRELVEGYFGKPIEAWREIKEFKYMDWMGWHEQGDGKLFLGVNVEQGRVKDYEESASLGSLRGVKVRSALRKIVSQYKLTTVLSPTQSIILKDIDPADKAGIESILAEHNVTPIESVDPLVRNSMACPALPLCGLALTEAERRMPDMTSMMRRLLDRLGLGDEEIMFRVTGCPNGCARPYMAELAFVGDGPDMYQIWLGGSPALTNVAEIYQSKVKWANMEQALEPVFQYWKSNRQIGESFGEFCHRVGMATLNGFADSYKPTQQ